MFCVKYHNTSIYQQIPFSAHGRPHLRRRRTSICRSPRWPTLTSAVFLSLRRSVKSCAHPSIYFCYWIKINFSNKAILHLYITVINKILVFYSTNKMMIFSNRALGYEYDDYLSRWHSLIFICIPCTLTYLNSHLYLYDFLFAANVWSVQLASSTLWPTPRPCSDWTRTQLCSGGRQFSTRTEKTTSKRWRLLRSEE